MVFEEDLGLGGEAPAAGAAAARPPAVGAAELRREARLDAAVAAARSGLRDHLAVDDLVKAIVLRNREQVGESGKPPGQGSHAADLRPARHG